MTPELAVAAVALRALVDGYAVAADCRDGVAFAALFTADASLVVADADGIEQHRHDGREALAAVPRLLDRYERTIHLVTTHHVKIDELGEARGVAYCEAHHLADGVDRVMYICYDDHYTHTPDAGWRIARRQVNKLWTDRRPLAS